MYAAAYTETYMLQPALFSTPSQHVPGPMHLALASLLPTVHSTILASCLQSRFPKEFLPCSSCTPLRTIRPSHQTLSPLSATVTAYWV